MGDRYNMKVLDGSDPDARPSWWEGWPLTVFAIVYSALFWAATLILPLWQLISSLFD